MGSVAGKLQHWVRLLLGARSPQRSQPRPPDFLCLGAQKAGTSWLYYELSRHPQIHMPEVKELHWFDEHKISWEEYLQHFQNAGNRMSGDITPSYLVCETAAEEIRRRAPAARLFAILRDPTERAFSQYRMVRHKKRIPDGTSFLEAFWSDAIKIRIRGHYAEQLTRYLEHYRLGNDLQVYLYDDLKHDPVSFIHRIDRFLGIKAYASPQVAEHYVHPGYSSDGLRITPEERKVVQEYYWEHNERLARLLGCELRWNHAALSDGMDD